MKQESESEAASESDGWGPDFMGKGDERESMLSLPEREREEKIYERQQERKRRQDAKAARLRRQSLQTKGKKRRSRQMSERSKEQKERQKWALEQIKQRKKKPKKQIDEDYREEQEEDGEDVELEPMDDHYDEDDIDEEKEQKPWKTETPINLKAVKKCMIRRNNLITLTKKGYMEEFIPRMFTRVFLGPHPRDRTRRIYACCRIVTVEIGDRPYKLAGVDKSGQGELTRKVIKVSMGKAEKSFQINRFSNESITEKELSKWRELMRKDGMEDEIPCCEELYHLRTKAEKLRKNFRYTDAVVQKMIQENEELGFVANPTLKKAELESQLEILDPSDTKKRENIVRRIKEIEKMESRDRKDHVGSEGATLVKINERQHEINQTRREKLRKQRLKRKNKGDDENAKLDPFKRTHTVSTGMVISISKDDENEGKRKKSVVKKRKKAKKQREFFVDSLLEGKLPIAEGKADAKDKDESKGEFKDDTKGYKDKDEAWNKMRDLCDVEIDINVGSTHIEPPRPTPVRALRKAEDYEHILSLQDYLKRMEDEAGAGHE
uniref:Plus3 domain-containing protein n=1 Tax=Amorphochlora amoebiformis TaxID=1561963 RepID=A0A7S0GZ30_9EUKA